MIRFDGVTKSYGAGQPAVDNLTLEAATGEITVLVGPSGCGKTTTLRMVNRLITPTSGTVSIDGVDTGTMDLTQLRRGIGYVIQQAGLFPHRTVVDNVATVPRLLGWGRAKARARAMDLIELVGLTPDLAKRYPASLSGGQQQRVGVARALAADPPIMLMDEPFSAVDPVVRDQLQQEFLKIQAELGKTTLFVTHDIDEAIKLGDHVAVLRVGGHLAQFAEPEKLLSDPVDDFVAEFVGRDRGYRALAFTNAPGLPLRPEPTIPLGATPAEVQAMGAQWVLALDDDKEPVGWVRTAAVDRPVDRTLLHRGGTVARIDGSLRALLDAALSSPSGRGVVATPDGRFAGVVLATDVLTAIERERDEHRASPTQAGSAAYGVDEREASS